MEHQGHKRACRQCLTDRNPHDFPAGSPQRILFKEFSDAKGDERQGDITDEAHPIHDAARHKMQDAGADHNAGNDIAADARHPQHIRKPCNQEPRHQDHKQGQKHSRIVIKLSPNPLHTSPSHLSFLPEPPVICKDPAKIPSIILLFFCFENTFS